MVANPTKRASSSGERAAILGYSKQYEFAACKIYRAMLSGNLNWVSFGNDDVGMFDDAIICSHQVINAFQIKTSEDPNSISISTALKDSDLKNIFESYTKIVSLYGTQAIQLNYVFAGYFSRQDRSAANNKSGGNLHTYALATFLNAYSSSESEYLDTNWSDYLKQWKDLSGFSEEKFGQFLSAIRLYDREEIAKEKIDNFDDEAQEKITLLSSLILTLVKKSSHKNTWSEDELIKELGWQKQLSQKFNHVFPIPENYQDNIATRQAIETILENTESGYISLLGAPGSGKSSLLERAIRTSKSHSVVRYLSFHPDRRHGLGRGEASEFLNDIVVALGKTGLPAKRLQRSDLSRLKEHFSDQLTAAGQRYEDTGKKTIIIVDGLDHIPREENPSESFLGVLPLPHSIPSGVVFLLGSQKLDLENLPLSVGQQAGQGDRTVSVQKLKRSDIAEIMRGGNMSEKVKISNFYASCEGNPLVAQYLLKALQGTNDEETIQSILSREHGIGRDIQEIYERLWKTIDDNHKLHDVLALLARSEGKISASELASETSDEQVEILLQQVSYLLDVEADTQISIFHNSFRLFIVEKTAMRFGKFNESKDQAYNMQLANIASNATKSSSQRWLELRYLYRAGKFEKVLKICTPKYFRSQLIEFRPESEIYTDLRLSYGSLNFSRDRVQLVKLLLIDKEISYRLEAISEMDAIELLMDGGAIDKAIKIALDGSMYGDGWKALVLFLLERNKKEVARQIFELNEPTEVLYGERQYQGRNLTDELETWIELARYFRSNSDILSIINAVAIDKTFGDDPDTDTLRLELRYHLAFQIVVENPQAINKKIGETYSLDREALIRLAIEAAEHQVKNDDIDSAREIFKRITCSGDLKKLHISWTRSALFLASKLGRDDLVADLLKITKPVSIGEYQNTSFRSDFKYILESRFLTSTLSLIHKYPALNNENSNKPVAVKLAKKIAELAIIIFNLENNEASEVGLKIKPIIAFWGNVRSTDNYDSLITAFRSNIEWLLPKIFRIIRHFDDKEFTSDIIQIILSVIETKGSNFANSDKFKLLFAEFLYDFEDYKNTALTLIGGVKSWSGDEYTPHEEVATKVLICHTLSNIGQIEDSRNFASKIHEGTLGYWLRAKKEPQYLFWNLALKNACAEEPDKCLGYTASYAKFLLGMEETEGHGTAYRMADDLLRGASYNPSSFTFIFNLLFNSKSTDWGTLSAVFIDSLVECDPSLSQVSLELYIHLALPFLAGESLAPMEKILQNLSSELFDFAVVRLVENIGIYSPLNARKPTLNHLKTIAPQHASIIDSELKRTKKIEVCLSGKEKKVAPVKQYEEEYDCDSLHELVDKYSGESKHSEGLDYFYISKGSELAKTDTKAGIQKFLTERAEVFNSAKFLIQAAKRMYDIGEKNYADSLFKDAEACADLKSWSAYLGGDKFNLLKLKVERNGDQGKEDGFNDLVSDLESGIVSGASLFSDLDEILEFISPNIKWSPVWEEVQKHLEAYREFKIAQPITLPQESNYSYRKVIGDFLSTALSLPCPTLQEFAEKAAIAIVKLDESSEVLLSLKDNLSLSEDGSRRLSSIIRCSENEIPDNKKAVAVCRELIRKQDFVCETLASITLGELGETSVPVEQEKLPSFYSLDFAGEQSASDFTPPAGLRPSERVLWTEDPWTWTSVLERQCTLASDATGFSIETIRRRTAQYMRLMGGKDRFGPAVEKEIADRLKSLDLPFSYSRPMPAFAILAFGKVISELYRANRIDPNVFPLLWKEMGGRPLSGFSLKYERQPDWLPMIHVPPMDSLSPKSDDWLLSAGNNITASTVKKGIILMEQVEFQINHWRTQYISHRVTAPKSNIITKSEYSLANIPMLYSIGSLQPIYSKEKSTGICRVSELNSHTIPFDAITLCPFLLKKLGWRRSKKNPFIIKNQSDELMAKTVFWKNGIGNLDPNTSEKNYFAKGQFLEIKEEAVSQLVHANVVIEMRTQVHHQVVDEKRNVKERFIHD